MINLEYKMQFCFIQNAVTSVNRARRSKRSFGGRSNRILVFWQAPVLTLSRLCNSILHLIFRSYPNFQTCNFQTYQFSNVPNFKQCNIQTCNFQTFLKKLFFLSLTPPSECLTLLIVPSLESRVLDFKSTTSSH